MYDTDGNLDLDTTQGELIGSAFITDDKLRGRKLAEITAAALLDIAASLRVVAADAASGLAYEAETAQLADGHRVADNPASDDAPRDFLLVGDLVHVIGDTDPGEVIRLGFDQGDAYAVVRFANGYDDRFYTRNLERIIGDEPEDGFAEAIVEGLNTIADLAASPVPLVGVATAAEAPALRLDDDGDGEEPVGGYELDPVEADFAPEPDAVTALDKLEAKPRKKATKK